MIIYRLHSEAVLGLTGIRAVTAETGAESSRVIASTPVGALGDVLVRAGDLGRELVNLELGMSVELEVSVGSIVSCG